MDEIICGAFADSLILFDVVDVVRAPCRCCCCMNCDGENATTTVAMVKENNKALIMLIKVRILYY